MAPTVIHWFRRDLRLTDNPALIAAAANGSVVPVFILSRWKSKHRWTGPRRQEFLCGCLRSLAENLGSKGARLILRAGPPADALRKLSADSGARALYFNRAVDPFGREDEARVAAMCREAGIACHGFQDAVLHEPGQILTQQHSPYRVFTPFGKAWLATEKPLPQGKPSRFTVPARIASLPMPNQDWWGLAPPAGATDVKPGEMAARQRMKHALEGIIPGYADRRDLPAGQTTSRLSQDLRFGLISIRELYHNTLHGMAAAQTAAARRGHEVFAKELGWREFYFQILHHFPDVLEHEFNPEFRALRWDDNPRAFERWASGTTGFPIVDAGMRQLLETGFMHNRVRMIVSMFLTKDLHIDWRSGEQHFMRHLVDGEIASNNGGWQWSAGTGADAAPYFRIQNPWSQTRRYDPDGTFIKRWVPELRDVSAPRFLSPPDDGRPLAPGYPLPMVDHARERDECLARFARARD